MGAPDPAAPRQSIGSPELGSPALEPALESILSAGEKLDEGYAPVSEGPSLPSELNLRHREIIRLAFGGLPATAIAEQVGLAVTTVRMILRSPLAQAEVARLSDRADDATVNTPMKVRLINELRSAGTDALKLNGELMRDKTVDPRVRAGIGKHFLDRIVFGQDDTSREGGYREILRSIDRLEKKLDPDTILIAPGQVSASDSANGRAEGARTPSASPPPGEGGEGGFGDI